MIKYILITLMITMNVKANEICGNVEQGGLIIKNGKLVAFSRDARPTKEYNIKKVSWDIQDIKGVPQKTVTPSKEDMLLIENESKQVKKAYAKKIKQKYWKNGFIKPLEGKISGKYGGQRIYNGTKKNPHLGVDIAKPTGTKIVASGDGVVTGVIKNGFYNGNLIIINHGDGLTTIYAHLSKNLIKEGDVVKKGDVIGLVGSTGRSTGPHLHFGTNLNGIKFNPNNLYKINDCLTNIDI